MKGIVDRIEGEYVVIEVDGQTQDVKKNNVSPTAKAGDVVVLVAGIWTINKMETEQREQHIKKLMDSVWED